MDINDDIRNISNYFDDNTVTNIICFQVLEHFNRAEWNMILGKLCRLVKPGGRIHLRVPAIEDAFEEYKCGRIDDNYLFALIYGMQHEFHDAPPDIDFHKSGVTVDTIKTELQINGFRVDEINHVYGLCLYHITATKDGNIEQSRYSSGELPQAEVHPDGVGQHPPENEDTAPSDPSGQREQQGDASWAGELPAVW